MNNEMMLNLKIDARFDWITPPTTTLERISRDRANNIVQRKAILIEQAVKLIVLTMVEEEYFPNTSQEAGKENKSELNQG